MSDVSQGPGWWQASDGKWYPPETHPDYRPPAPPPGYGAPQAPWAPPQAPWAPPQAPWAPPQAPWAPAAPPGGPGQWPHPMAGPATGTATPPYGAGYPAGPYGYGAPPGWGYPRRPVFMDPWLAQPLAPWWKRLLAILLDGVILGAGYLIVFGAIGVAIGNQPSDTTPGSPAPAGAVIGGLIVLWLVASLPAAIYYGALNGSRRGQTVGKMALGIAVRDARTGMPIGFWRAFGRYAITVVFSLLLWIPALLDALAPLWDSRRQAWHDKIASSVVVDLRP